MTPQEFRELIRPTLDDHKLSRSERRALTAVLEEIAPPATQLDVYRHEAFNLAREDMSSGLDRPIIDWLEDLVRLLKPASDSAGEVQSEAWFSPGDGCRDRIRSLFNQARHCVDVCVFTITDNEVSEVIAAAHNRGVELRIVSDNDKAFDTGSDIDRLIEHGVPVRIDRTEHHMHHKFAIFDNSILVTGSYNWTRSAAANNEENIIVTGDKTLIRRFQQTFNELWDRFA
ncbi:MAG: endonuclease [Planctomycetaceae bacterium]|nr:endonuclease [Planctomycetaceae bacterium]